MEDETRLLQGGMDFARTLIQSIVSSTRAMFEEDQMEAELPYLERLFLDKVGTALRAQPQSSERSVVVAVAAAPALVKGEPVEDGDDGHRAPRALDEPVLSIDRMLHPSGVVPRIDNVMSSANLGCAVDLKRLVQRVGNVVYEPKRHTAVSIYFHRPKGTVQLYASGKLVCTGCRSEEDARSCARKCATLVRRATAAVGAGVSPRLTAFRVTNIFAACDAGFDVRLAHLAAAHGLEYNPERSAKLTWHRTSPAVALEITSRGHVGISGTTHVQELSTAFEQVYPQLQAFGTARAASARATPVAFALSEAAGDGADEVLKVEP